jgi:hypothetical protein
MPLDLSAHTVVRRFGSRFGTVSFWTLFVLHDVYPSVFYASPLLYSSDYLPMTLWLL